MIRSLYTASSGMLAQRKHMDVLVNNIVNGETTAYRSETLVSRSFRDVLIHRMDDPAVVGYESRVGPLGGGIHIDEVVTRFTQGPLEETGNATDLAITGDAFFVVDTPQGARYTRDGGFSVSSGGYLTTADGHPVLGEAGYLYVGGTDFTVDGTGQIARQGQPVGRLQMVAFGDNAALRKQGHNLFVNYGNAPTGRAEDFTLRQGFIEGSNVDLSASMVEMIRISRLYETNQRIVSMLDETLGKTVNDVGRV